MTDTAKLNPAPNDVPLPLPSWRVVVALALPVLAQQGLSFLVILSDRFLAGHLTTASAQEKLAVQAAQTTAHYLAWFITCYNVLVTVGSTALVARCIGARDRRLAVEVTHQSLLLAVFLGLLATVWAFLGGVRWLVHFLRLRGDAADNATEYLLILFGLIVFQTVEVAGIACLVGAGDTRTGLWVMAGVACVNVPLAWGFSRGYYFLPRLGFAGIAVGTALSYTLGGLVVVTVLARGRFGLKLSVRDFRPRLDLLYRLLRISVPAGFDSGSVVAGQLWFLSIINQLGNDASSAHGIAIGWEGLGYLSGAAFGTAAMSLVGQNLGAGRPEDASRAGWMSFALAGGIMSLMAVVFYTLAPVMFRLFCPDPEQAKIIELGVPVLRLVAFAMPALASTIVFTYALRGAGDTRVPVIFTWIGFFLVRVPLAYYLAWPHIDVPVFGSVPGMNLGLYGCWLAMFADIVVRGVFFSLRFAHGAWRQQKV
jgi:putative MATE family efflux protein